MLFKKTSDVYFEAFVRPETQIKIRKENQAKVLFTYSSFLDVGLIECRVHEISTTVNKDGLFRVSLVPEKSDNYKLTDHLMGTAFMY